MQSKNNVIVSRGSGRSSGNKEVVVLFVAVRWLLVMEVEKESLELVVGRCA